MYKFDLSVIIVSWNVRDKLRENLKSLYNSDKQISFEIFVVDNNSNDDTVTMIRTDFPEVQIIANTENFGFAKANNQAIKLATGKHILLLNPDMRVLSDTLSKMTNWFDAHIQAAVAGCKLTDENDQLISHVRRFPTIFDQLAIVLKIPHLFPGVLNHYLAKDFNYDLPGKVDSVRGSFFMLRRINERLPLLDERYFVWFEEVDYCKQARNNDLEVWYTPVTTCIDFVGGSFKQLQKGRSQDYFRDSMLKYFKKWHPRWQYLVLSFFWPLGKFIATIASSLKINSKQKT